MSAARDGFFAVNKSMFDSALNLGLKQACAYLVIARGTGRSNTVSAWSNNSVESYTGLARSRAKMAVDDLIRTGVIEKISGGSRPQYQLMEGRKEKLIQDDVFWLPNGLIVGVNGETPPIQQIRETGDVMLLDLLINLYGEQNLIEDGGLSPRIFKTVFDKKIITERAQFNILGFDSPGQSWSNRGIAFIEKHRNDDGDLSLFFDRMRTLQSIGLLELTTHLMESEEDGEPIVEMSEDLLNHGRQACESLIGEDNQMINRLDNHDDVMPVERHYKNVALVRTYRTRYKPRTKMTGVWAIEKQKIQSAFVEKYTLIINGENDKIQYKKQDVKHNLQHKG